MLNIRTACLLFAALSLLAAEPALAHHAMGGATPATLAQGLLSGLAHPVIGLDHLAVVVAVGCLAAAHRGGALLVAGCVLAMMAGVAGHVHGVDLAASELVLAAVVIALGIVLVLPAALGTATLFALFVLAGLVSGYALGESIVGAEPTPLFAYLAGLTLVQLAIALSAMALVRRFLADAGFAMRVRLVGLAVIGIGLVGVVTQATVA